MSAALFEKWAKAVRDANWSEVRANHDPEIVMFDVPPPNPFARNRCVHDDLGEIFSWSDAPVAFDLHYVSVTAGKDVAFITARAMRRHLPKRSARDVGIPVDHGSAQD